MRAWVAPAAPKDTSQPTSALVLKSGIPVPTPSATQARIRVVCASLNPVDVMRAGTPTCIFPAIIGTDGAGLIDAFGDDAEAQKAGFAVGDAVFFHNDTTGTQGTFAEFTLVELAALARLRPPPPPPPQGAAAPQQQHRLSLTDAAAMPSAAWTAYMALFDKLDVKKGRVIFIDGAAGGVGSFAVQMCKRVGLYVIATCSTYNVDYVKSLGADVVVDYIMDDVSDKLREWTQSHGVDYLLELVNPEQAARYAHHIRFGGALCQVGGAIKTLDTIFFHHQISVHHVHLNGFHKNPQATPLLPYVGAACVQMVANGMLTPCYREVIPFEQGRDALGQLAQGHARGKIVMRMLDAKALHELEAAEAKK